MKLFYVTFTEYVCMCIMYLQYYLIYYINLGFISISIHNNQITLSSIISDNMILSVMW